MDKDIKFIVYLSLEYSKYFNSEYIISEKGTIECFSIVHSAHYLEIEALYNDPDGPGRIHLHIPHSRVLLILSSPEIQLGKIHGFHSPRNEQKV